MEPAWHVTKMAVISITTASRDAVERTHQDCKPVALQVFAKARPERFELPTFGSVDRRSIQLSYGRFVLPFQTV